jgi:hypothetical protein
MIAAEKNTKTPSQNSRCRSRVRTGYLPNKIRWALAWDNSLWKIPFYMISLHLVCVSPRSQRQRSLIRASSKEIFRIKVRQNACLQSGLAENNITPDKMLLSKVTSPQQGLITSISPDTLKLHFTRLFLVCPWQMRINYQSPAAHQKVCTICVSKSTHFEFWFPPII